MTMNNTEHTMPGALEANILPQLTGVFLQLPERLT